ncbi:MAG: hypothetical protein WBA68_05100 [Alteraurantiacibacter sp.]
MQRFAYQLTRVNDPTRLFRVEFDASEPMLAPTQCVGLVRAASGRPDRGEALRSWRF